MKYENIILDSKENIAIITLNRPERLNIATPELGEELKDVFSVVNQDPEIRVAILTGNGRTFSAGADLNNWFLPLAHQKASGAIADKTRKFLEEVPNAIAKLRKPLIASVNGAAIGFGFTLALACDIRIASEEARFSMAFTRVGISPELGSTYFLPRLIGFGKACELIFTAKMISAMEAKEMGLVNQVVPVGELAKTTYEMATSISKLAPLALENSKRILYQGLSNDPSSQLQLEIASLYQLFGSDDFKEGCRAILEKRAPLFKGK